jgi:hypothetical protein
MTAFVVVTHHASTTGSTVTELLPKLVTKTRAPSGLAAMLP